MTIGIFVSIFTTIIIVNIRLPFTQRDLHHKLKLSKWRWLYVFTPWVVVPPVSLRRGFSLARCFHPPICRRTLSCLRTSPPHIRLRYDGCRQKQDMFRNSDRKK